MEIFVLVLMLLMAHFAACVALLTVARNKIIGRLYLLSLIGTWIGYFSYEAFVVDCPLSKCNIRPDLLLIFPYLIIISGIAIYGMRRHFIEDDVSRAVSDAAASKTRVAPGAVETRASDGTSELMISAALGDLRGIKRLLDNGADLEAVDERGWTSLMFAASRDELGAVDLLLRKGADPSRKSYDQLTAGEIALRQGNHEVATLLNRDLT